jgi:aminoglycoside phosphotransferase
MAIESSPQSIEPESALCATAEQLDIAAEDAESALDSVLASFDSAAEAIEKLEAAMHTAESASPETLLPSVIALRQLLRRSVVDLQFQDRLIQRLAMAAREMRALAGTGDPDLFAGGAVPSSAASLYTTEQLKRINKAAGQENKAIEMPSADDDIELF